MGQNGIAHQHGCDQWPIEPRKRDEAERATGPCERKRDSDDANDDVVVINAGLALLSIKGILAVRMIWIMSVCVRSDSVNHPVWKSDGLFQAWNTNNIIA